MGERSKLSNKSDQTIKIVSSTKLTHSQHSMVDQSLRPSSKIKTILLWSTSTCILTLTEQINHNNDVLVALSDFINKRTGNNTHLENAASVIILVSASTLEYLKL